MHIRFIVAEFAAIAAMLLAFVGCHTSDKSRDESPMNMQNITGSVAYHLRIALPPNAVVNLRLEDISRTDAPATLIAEKNIATEGRQVPISFALNYDAAKVVPTHRYQVRATIKSNDELLFTTTREYPVLTHGASDHVEILVEQPRGSGTRPNAPKSTSLEDTFWRLVELNGQPALPSNGPWAAGITFVAREHIIGANTSVNSMGGEYMLNGQELTIKPGMMTMMAGPEPLMNQERAFIAALGTVTTFRISDQTLELLAGRRVVMKLEAAQR